MANLEGYQRYAVERFCSQVDQDDPINLPIGVLAVARNCKFVLTRVRTRDGINKRLGPTWVGMDMATGKPVTGLYAWKFSGNGVLPDKQVPMAFDSAGNLKIESPPGSGIMVPVSNSSLALPAGSYLQADQTENRSYLAFTNIANPSLGTSVNAVYDLNTGNLDPLSMRPVGQAWQPNTKYAVGEMVSPQPGNAAIGHTFRCTQAGVSGANQPVWNTADSSNTSDNTVVWQELTLSFSQALPTCDVITTPNFGSVLVNSGNLPLSGLQINVTTATGPGSFPSAQSIFIAVTLVNQAGQESAPVVANATAFSSANTQVTVTVSQTVRSWLAALPANLRPVSWNLYEADTAHGNPQPGLGSFKLVSAALSLNVTTSVNINSSAIGSALSTTLPSAFLNGAGNVDAGERWALVLFVNRNGYISGYSQLYAQQSTAVNNPGNFGLFAANIPIGPPNTAARYVCFSLAGASSAGPFVYIPANDTVNGAPITSTIINDNVTTTASFNFTDVYLQDLLATSANVQPFFDKIQLPPCRAIIHSPTMDRMIYLTYNLPSGAYITPQLDPETVFGSTGLVQVSETDGQNLMGWVHFDGIEYALKEESGHEVNPSADNPSEWQTVEKWTGRGPCGLRAYDVGAHFFVFVHRSGVFANFGGKPEWISKELGSADDRMLTTWKRINWAAAATIWVMIDDDTHEIRIGVPLDNATTPTHVLKCNYEESPEIAPAIHSTIYSKGKFISTAAARKWSLDTIAANSCIRARRNLVSPPVGLDANTQISQILYASAFDSSINAVTPGIFTDNGNAIDWVCEGVAPVEALKDSRFGGLQALIGGSGSITVEVLVGSARAAADGGVNVRQKELKLRDAHVKPGVYTSYTAQQEGRGERFRARFSTTGKPPGTWGEILQYALYISPVFQVQASGSK